MEIIELIVGSVQFCGCFLELGAALVNGFAGVQTGRYVQAKRDGLTHRRMRNVMWIAWIAGISLLILVLIRWAWRTPA